MVRMQMQCHLVATSDFTLHEQVIAAGDIFACPVVDAVRLLVARKAAWPSKAQATAPAPPRQKRAYHRRDLTADSESPQPRKKRTYRRRDLTAE